MSYGAKLHIIAGESLQLDLRRRRWELTRHRKILDDQFEHALRLFRDRDSHGFRLQASVRRGELKQYVRYR
jgi:hypothetical protein